MKTLYTPELAPVNDTAKYEHAYVEDPILTPEISSSNEDHDDEGFFTPRHQVEDPSSLSHSLNALPTILPNSASFNLSTNSTSPPTSPKTFPREALVRKHEEIKTEAESQKQRRKLRKKRKFRLIPTFKHLEKGRFVGRHNELKHIRSMLVKSTALTYSGGCFEEKGLKKNLERYNKLSIISLTGCSGVGKSSLAYVYLMAHEHKYKYVFWLNSYSILSDARDILLYHLKNKHEILSMKNELNAETIRIRFLNFLALLKSDWLLIVDDYNNVSNIKVSEWIPQQLESLSIDSVHQIKHGHVIITTNNTISTVRREFCNFQTGVAEYEVQGLTQKDCLKLVTNIGVPPRNEKDKDSLLRLMGVDYLNNHSLSLTLLTNLLKFNSYSWRTLFVKFKDELNIHNLKKVDKLKKIFKRIKSQETKKSATSQLFARNQILNTFSSNVRRRPTDLMDLDGFNSELFEIELLLRKFKILKYFASLIALGKSSLDELAQVINSDKTTHYWRELTYVSKVSKRKKKIHKFDPRDEEKFKEMTRYVAVNLAQRRIDVCIKLWLESLSATTTVNSISTERAVSILRQAGWLAEHRIPLFIFPELLLEQSENNGITVSPTYSNSSQASDSTITHNSAALSTLSGSAKICTKLNGSSRFSGRDLGLFGQHQGLLSFFINNCLLKMEKTGFCSCNVLIKRAIMNIEAQTEESFDTVIAVLRKMHIIGFEFNFDDIVGESLSLLRSNPDLIRNNYTRIELKFLENLSDMELQIFNNHDFNLKLNLLPHFHFIRRFSFKELTLNKGGMMKYTEKVSAPVHDVFGVNHKQVRDFNKYLRLMTNKDGKSLFNASRAALFPEFSSRDLTLIKADIMFNEGLLVLAIPFRNTRLRDAFNCFKTAYDIFIKAANKQTGKDLTMSKCCFHMGVCLFKLRNFKDALRVFQLALRHFHDFHGEYSNHPDTARTLSSLGCVYHELAKQAITNNKSKKIGAHDIIDENHMNLGIGDLLAIHQAGVYNSHFHQVQCLDVDTLIKQNNTERLCEESFKYHQLSIQMYLDILGPKPVNSSYAKTLVNRAQTLVLLETLQEAEKDLLEAMSIYEKLSKENVIYLRNVHNVSMTMVSLYSKLDEDYERFIFYLDKSMQAASNFSKYELDLFEERKLRNNESKTTDNDLSEHILEDLSPHPMLCDSLVSAAEILVKRGGPEANKKATVFLQTALEKYQGIFVGFDHPRLKFIRQRLKSLKNNS